LSAAVLGAVALSLATPEAAACASPSELQAEPPLYSGAVDYFPQDRLDALDCHWFSQHLASLEEARLTSEGVLFRLRFLELPALDYPMAITVTAFTDGMARIEARASNGVGGGEPGKLVYRQLGALSQSQIGFLTDEVARADMCAPPGEGSDGAKPAGAQGTRNVFEWASGDIYCLRHADAREDTPLSKLAIWLVQRVYEFEVPPPPLRP
jgi:hypothetical protein